MKQDDAGLVFILFMWSLPGLGGSSRAQVRPVPANTLPTQSEAPTIC